MITVAELEQRWPELPWREPLHVERPDGAEGWACRICVAQHGIRGRDVAGLPKTAAEVLEHIEREHPPADTLFVVEDIPPVTPERPRERFG